MKKNGFTLIELVVVIVILGILAVVAAPKFMNLQNDARDASLKGLEGAIASGIGAGYAKMTIAGQETLPYVSNISPYPDLNIPAQDLPFTGCTLENPKKSCTFIYGYPDADSTSLQLVVANLDNSSDWKLVMPAIGAELREIKITFSKYVDSSTTFDDIKQCYITYAPPVSENANYTLTMTPCK
ncbi:type II secretion system protein [Photobacterium leiognathi]|uniref:type II secretion system protein n=1 Tax=Photobacterium leiognathi TaxID=553611 RepID=UPI002735E708|nr:prepilin-type N-terminal cleavage/methylation domain-containing protein [Photobacterium leiognathi]